MTSKVNVRQTKFNNRSRKCRLCNEMIQKDQYAVVFERVHVSPKIVDLFFHHECLVHAVLTMEIEDEV